MQLQDYQKLVQRLSEDRGFEGDSIEEAFLLLTEEVGELAKAIRQQSRLQNGAHSKKRDLEDECADVLWLLLAICNKVDVDLAEAFKNKEIKNAKRFE